MTLFALFLILCFLIGSSKRTNGRGLASLMIFGIALLLTFAYYFLGKL